MMHCKKHHPSPILRMGEAKTLEEYIQALEDDRDNALAREKTEKGKAEAQAFYDNVIANWKKKDHLCNYDPDNHFICPVCGDSF